MKSEVWGLRFDPGYKVVHPVRRFKFSLTLFLIKKSKFIINSSPYPMSIRSQLSTIN